MCCGPAGELVLGPFLPVEPIFPPTETLSLHGRLAHSRRTGDGLIKEGETAGVKATLWPEVKSGGSRPAGISESRGVPHATTDGLCASTVPNSVPAPTIPSPQQVTGYICTRVDRSLPVDPMKNADLRRVCGLQLSHVRMYICATEGVCDAAHVLVISANASKRDATLSLRSPGHVHIHTIHDELLILLFVIT